MGILLSISLSPNEFLVEFTSKCDTYTCFRFCFEAGVLVEHEDEKNNYNFMEEAMIKIKKYTGINDVLDIIKGRFEISEKYEIIVKDIIKNVVEKKDLALVEYTQKFDSPSFKLSDLKVSKEEIKAAYGKVDAEFMTALDKAIANIKSFHEKQKRNSWMNYGKDGEVLGMKITPLQRVGLYVPGGQGGSTPLVSSVLMNGIPAKVAGVDEMIMITPPNDNNEISPYLLVAADKVGIDEVYKTASAWGVAAMAYGTETIRAVNKIVGPGNIYVTVAKKMLYGKVDIDMIAGPSEVMIIADEHANPEYVAADLLSQAEHDTMAASILVTTSMEVAEKTAQEIEKQLKQLSRESIARESIDKNGLIVVTDNLEDVFTVANEIAPEHLELELENPFEYIGKIRNAGAIFLGKYTPEPVGDYFAGPNHVLPTNMTAKFYSPLSVDDFIKKSSIVYYPKELLMREADNIIRLAEVEGLTAHANSIKVRKNNE